MDLILKDLDLTVPLTPEFASLRATYHTTISTTLSTMTALATRLCNLNPNPTSIAILLPDLFPDSNDSTAVALIACLEAVGISPPSILRRRKERGSAIRLTALLDWDDEKTFANHDLIFILCSSSSFPILHSVSLTQAAFPNTIFIPSCRGVSRKRVEGLVGSELVVMVDSDKDIIDLVFSEHATRKAGTNVKK